jgi:hypothetical protein
LSETGVDKLARWNLAQIVKLKVSPKVGRDSISKFQSKTPEKKMHMTPPRVRKKNMYKLPPINDKYGIEQIAQRNLAQRTKLKVRPRIGQDSVSKLEWGSGKRKMHIIPPKVWGKKMHIILVPDRMKKRRGKKLRAFPPGESPRKKLRAFPPFRLRRLKRAVGRGGSGRLNKTSRG